MVTQAEAVKELKQIFSTHGFDWMTANNSLRTREYDVLLLKYKDNKSLQCIGDLFTLSRERVRQIHDKAVPKALSQFKKKTWESHRFKLLLLLLSLEQIEKLIIEILGKIALTESLLCLASKTPIGQLNLETRTYNALWRSGYCTVADILALPDEEDLLSLRCFGDRSLNDLRHCLKEWVESIEDKIEPILEGVD